MKISIIGAGNMGGAIAYGVVAGKVADKADVKVADPTVEKTQAMAADLGIETFSCNLDVVEGADIVVVAVKPWLVETVLGEIKAKMDYSKQMLVSIAAGVDFETLSAYLDRGDGAELPPMFRVIPNTAISIMKSVTFIACHGASDVQVETVRALFASMGEAVLIEEDMMTAGTSLASCGIAFAFKYLDASISGGVELGFSEEDSRRIVMGTMKGALGLLDQNQTMPQTEIDKVTTPGGITLKGLAAMAENEFDNAVKEGLRKSH